MFLAKELSPASIKSEVIISVAYAIEMTFIMFKKCVLEIPLSRKILKKPSEISESPESEKREITVIADSDTKIEKTGFLFFKRRLIRHETIPIAKIFSISIL